MWPETMAGRTLDTVYFGGGTPTSLSAEHLERVMEKLKTTFDFFRSEGIYARGRQAGQYHRG